MIKSSYFYTLLAIGSTSILTAQQSKINTDASTSYRKALELYHNQQYQASQLAFKNVKSHTEDNEIKANSDYYIANAAIRLNQLGADDLMESFVENYPTSTKRSSAYLDVADYYFDHGKYAYALKWYNKADDQVSTMSYGDEQEYNFKKGYALFATKKYADAKTYLTKVTTSAKYGSKAKYYIGYMAYNDDDYSQANQYFDQISGDEALNKNLSYYQADMNFKLGNFQKAIDEGLQKLPSTRGSERSELNKIIGESYFNLKKYNEAIPYLKEYKGKRGKWSNTDYYLLGYAYYQQKDYESAIGQFNKIVGGNNPVAQNAYYHLAKCYLEVGKKQEALNAFRNASQMTYDKQITQDAALNYARLSYDIGNPYESVPLVLTNYLKTYPDSGHQDEIQELLVDSYITSKNYDAALDLLEKNRNYASKVTYQKVAFYRGVELFNDANYNEAKHYFERSLEEKQDQKYVARATYWNAETDYLLHNYNEALLGFKDFLQNSNARSTTEYTNINYDLGYAYYKLKDYNQAVSYFEKYTKNSGVNQDRLNDAYLRIGDSYFVMSKYWPAMEAYNKSIAMGGNDSDYANFQKAISYGFVNRNERKIEELNNFVNNYLKSPLRDDAYYELGNTYINSNQTEKGIAAYDELIAQYKMSSFVPKAMLKKGLIYYNSGRNDQAIKTFKEVVNKYPNTQEATQAVATAKLIYVDEGKVSEYAAWVKNLDFVEVTNADLDNATFESAERQYLDGKNDAAIKGLNDYVNQFPNGLHALAAHFDLAQAYEKNKLPENAIPHYEYVIGKSTNEYTEQSLTSLAQIYLDAKNEEKAKTVLAQLEREAQHEQNVTFSESNLMKINYEQGNYPQTIAYAEKVLSNSKVDNRIKSDAHVMIARSAIKTNDEARARKAYAEVQQIATGELAAEALYYDAYFKNKDGKFEASNTAIQKLAKNYSGYKEWGGKGLLLMAQNFKALNDAFQATYILENVIKNFSKYEDIVAEAKAELAKMKAEEAKTNSSVQPTEENQN
ncbi:tetratricopeptide repeat protein [Zhouia sp. PK063]|uniref:tetratricopeptide repeat protein n=1 Tax=Zhouia sp. PK063 TaxID=3373602 RepID=UPI0037A80EC8